MSVHEGAPRRARRPTSSASAYELAVFALSVATLPAVTTASTRDAVKAEILKHDPTSATLSGTYTP